MQVKSLTQTFFLYKGKALLSISLCLSLFLSYVAYLNCWKFVIGFVAKKVNASGSKNSNGPKIQALPWESYKSSNAEVMIIKLFEQNSS
jgi:hypothetical protein